MLVPVMCRISGRAVVGEVVVALIGRCPLVEGGRWGRLGRSLARAAIASKNIPSDTWVKAKMAPVRNLVSKVSKKYVKTR